MLELLIVIAVISILVALLLTGMGRATESAHRVQCVNNLRQISIALAAYGSENDQTLPLIPISHTQFPWAWDLSQVTRDTLMSKYGLVRETFYCPSNPSQNTDETWKWNGTYTVTGYFWLIENTTLDHAPPLTKSGYVANYLHSDAVNTELVTDATLSQNGNFEQIWGGATFPHHSSHKYKGDKPDGGNILFLDGHVAWRNFKQMIIRRNGPEHWF